MAYGELNQSVKNTWLTQQVNDVPKSYTETAKLMDHFVNPKTGKSVSASTQPTVTFMQTFHIPPNNRQSLKAVGYKTSRVETENVATIRAKRHHLRTIIKPVTTAELMNTF